ncbi:hypothetical protein [Variovorax sp.]|uniref:hypothetical protein n=1 Tax=Variovorax sp. TaxID=1871043 RepID=UPI003BAD0ADF
MKTVGTFESARWGSVTILRGHYGRANGPTAIQLVAEDGEPLATLSVNMYRPDCSHDSSRLPADCFYVKTWGGNEELAEEAMRSGHFVLRADLGLAHSGHVSAPAWQVTDGGAAGRAFPAVVTMHCPHRTTNACEAHARTIRALYSRVWGMGIAASTAPAGAQCDNCVNEAAAKAGAEAAS